MFSYLNKVPPVEKVTWFMNIKLHFTKFTSFKCIFLVCIPINLAVLKYISFENATFFKCWIGNFICMCVYFSAVLQNNILIHPQCVATMAFFPFLSSITGSPTSTEVPECCESFKCLENFFEYLFIIISIQYTVLGPKISRLFSEQLWQLFTQSIFPQL